MKQLFGTVSRRLAMSAFVLAAWGGTAHAENHALIMWIGEYSNPKANLPGIDKDAAMARQIARGIGVKDANIVEIKNRQLDLADMKSAIGGLTSRIQNGDRVFLYYSGHGGQVNDPQGGGKCVEGMVSYDLSLYSSADLEQAVDKLASKAAQVVFMNDSCFSGGVASSKALPGEYAPKYYAVDKSGGDAGANYTCGEAINKAVTRGLARGTSKSSSHFLYVAASSDREVSWARPDGSAATVAWSACLADPKTDANGDGVISGEELRVCAQSQIPAQSQPHHQTITLSGNRDLPVGLQITVAPSQPVRPDQTLESIRAGGAQDMVLTLSLGKETLSIGRHDKLDFTVTSPKAGYLYLLHIGTDGETFDVLFPNDFDGNNRIEAGTHRFPRPKWAIQAAGPAGTGYLMAYLSESPTKDFRAGMNKLGPFASARATTGQARNLMAVATGEDEPGGGRYGTSPVVAVKEVP